MRPTLHSPASRRQRGLTLILMLTILTLGTTYFLVRQMNALGQRLGQDRATSDVLAQAKQALIGYAAQRANRPGALPCPDNDNNGWADDQQSPPTPDCNQANERVGRLPWKTLGLPDLRDSAGERLWYALSDSLRDKGVVNSNSAGELTIYDGVSGAVVANNVIAMIIAPGAELPAQNRSVSGVGARDPLGATVTDSARANVANYLEGRNNYVQDAGGINDNAFVQPAATATYPRGQCPISGAPGECNDRLISITHNDLFSVVENMVASRLQSAVATFINSYFAIWNAYPFPGTFTDPDAFDKVGTAGVTAGLLPVTDSKNKFTWVASGAGVPTITVTGGGGAVQFSTFFFSPSPRCTNSTPTQLICDLRYRYNWDTRPALATVHVTARVANIGRTFATFPDPSSGNMGRLAWSHFVANNNYFTNTEPAGTHVMTLLPYLNSDGTQTLTYSFPLTYQDSFSTRTVRLNSVGGMDFLSPPFVSALTSEGYGNDWFVRNEWFKLLQYAVSPDYLPRDSAVPPTCTAPNCLTVSNLPIPPANNDKAVVLVLAGRAIGTQDRSSSAARSQPFNYFESPNCCTLPPANNTFRQDARSLTFNDRVIVVK
ncbi:MAG: hypothetical protein HY661_08435 [Betaproteobacteria bacterium]|nr:hypothetical protein [Betaproteobacteria bacterium]